MPGLPVMTGVTRVTNGLSVTWDGPSGYYQLFQRQMLENSTWQAVGTPYNLSWNATITTLSSNAFFRVSGPTPQYVGAQACAECHSPVLNTVVHTAHFSAFSDPQFVSLGGQTNSSCLPCHTVGYNLPTGFVSQSATPYLAGVQCENCHGPASNHAANPGDPTATPRVELAATMCGGCHNAQSIPPAAASLHPPYYEEWNASPHRAVLDELKAAFASSNGPSVFIPICGRCHSGTVREAFLENNPSLPDAHEASAVGIACATCHEPHAENTFTNQLPGNSLVTNNNELGTVYTNQLRNPLSSTNNYSMTNGPFASQYNPNINLCAQCHNDRGASYTDWNFPPHQSPQYNMLLGTVGELASGAPPNLPGAHSRLQTQCVGCHMQTAPYVSPSQPAIAGHTFAVNSYAVCAGCHGSAANASNLVVFVSGAVTNQIQTVQASLNQWATNKAPAILGTAQYGTRAWEYIVPGTLSPGGPGPTNAALQSLIPVNIQKARFNLYLVLYDGSLGVHNPNYSIELLYNAQTWVDQELSP